MAEVTEVSDNEEEIGSYGTPLPRVTFHRDSPFREWRHHIDFDGWRQFKRLCDEDLVVRASGILANDYNIIHEGFRALYLGRKQ